MFDDRWGMMLIASVVCLGGTSNAFYDDFEDYYIGDWTPRCASGSWSAIGGSATGWTYSTPAVLINPTGMYDEDCVISTMCTGFHAFGVIARLNEGDTGIIAYVSPDNDIARIRLVENGHLAATLQFIYAPFPSDEDYLLTFSCEGPILTFDISIPATGDSWVLTTSTSLIQPGESGLLMGDEACAAWQWFSLSTDLEEQAVEEVLQPVVTVVPNPFTDMIDVSVQGISDIASYLEIFDLSGRVIASVASDPGKEGSTGYHWNGITLDGRSAPSGVYLVRLSMPGSEPSLHSVVRID